MKKIENVDLVVFKELWNIKTKFRFNQLCIGSLFRQCGEVLAVGGEDGIIRLYDLSANKGYQAPMSTLETKSGPIQTMAIHDVTRFYHNDLIVADSCGTLTIFCNQQILCRKNVLKSSINFLQVDQDKSENSSIVLSTEAGEIVALLPSTELWRINLNSLSKFSKQSQQCAVTCLISAFLPNGAGQVTNHIIAADDDCNLYIIHQGSIVLKLKTSAVITAMCQGRFLMEDRIVNVDESNSETGAGNSCVGQIALGSQTGSVYILHNFSITEDEYCNCQYPITTLKSFSVADKDTDLLL